MKDSKKYVLFKQNSELETLISAAIVFVVVSVNDLIPEALVWALNNNVPGTSVWMVAFGVAALYLMALLPMSIIIHFLFRIYWLSLVGLKSVFTENKEALDQYHPYFKKRIERYQFLEPHIERVDRISSSLFAFTILSLFAFCFSFMSVFLIVAYVNELGWIGASIVNILLVFGLLYAFDFLSLGRVKRIQSKYFQMVYRPFYWFFSVITLAWLYRGIYYTLIHNVPKKVIGVLIPIYALVAILLLNLGYYPDGLLPQNYRNDDRGFLASYYYYQSRISKGTHVNRPFIESEVVSADRNYLTVNIPITYDLEDSLLSSGEIVPFQDQGMHWRRFVTFPFNSMKYPDGFDEHENAEKILQMVSEKVVLAIDDSTFVGLEYHFSSINEPRRYLFKTNIPISYLKAGDHVLHLQIPKTSTPMHYHIPFYRDK